MVYTAKVLAKQGRPRKNAGMSINAAQTSWHVITGAPCSGKTAVIDALAGLGYRIVPEVARAHIDQQLAMGRSLWQIKADPLVFERRILNEKADLENRLPADQTVFLDRAVPDSMAYYELEGLDPAEPLALSRTHRYASVFFFEPLPFEKDPVRSEDRRAAARLTTLLKKSYRVLGYEVITVPVLPVDQRLRFVLRHACPPS
jgi:predicted ATPase